MKKINCYGINKFILKFFLLKKKIIMDLKTDPLISIFFIRPDIGVVFNS